MKDVKDRNQKGKTQGVQGKDSLNPDEEGEYRFLKEVIKKKPVDKRRICFVVGSVLVCAVLFGMVAAFTFAKVLPYMQPEEEVQKVNIPVETPTPTPEGEQNSGEDAEKKEQEDEDREATEKTSDVQELGKDEAEKNLDLDDFRGLYRHVVEMAEEPERSLVTVQGITSDVDWMNNSYENEKQISGFLVADNTKEYFVLTEYRVVENVDRILVTFSNGRTVDAHFQKQDPSTGLAVLKIRKDEVDSDTRDVIKIAELGSSTVIQRGEPVLAVGSPAGYSGSIAFGMVTSSTNKKNTVDNEYTLFTTDIMGDSEGSGVLMSLEGKIIGVIVQSFSMEAGRDVVTAVPISEVRGLIEKLSNNEDIIYLGVRGQNISADLAQKTGIPKGIYVNEVEEDSPAMVGGIQNGDVIVKIQNEGVETLSQLRRQLDKYKAEQKISVTAMRKGAEGYVEIVFDVTVGAL